MEHWRNQDGRDKPKPIHAGPGCYLNDLICSASTTVTTNYPLIIKAGLFIESGTFNPLNYDLYVGRNWENQVGPSAFIEGTGKVFFNGSDHQYINASETFYRINLNKTGGGLWVDGSTATVTCAQYDWTSGAIGTITGTLTINDLIDAGIYGGYYVNSGCTINISNPGGSLDLKDVDVTFNGGGTININADSGTSSWQDVNLTMSGTNSLFAFNGLGISISSSSSYSPTFTINGGTIRTSGSFQNNRSTFAPTAGILELNGTSSTNLYLTAGSLYDLKISKDATSSVVLVDNTTCTHIVTVSSGILSLGAKTLDCGSNMLINASSE